MIHWNMQNKHWVLFIYIFCFMFSSKAQNMTEEEAIVRFNEAYFLLKDEKISDALNLFQIVSENTKLQRSDLEKQIFVRSQSMVCRCYELLGRYKEGFLLGKELLQGQIEEEERQFISYLFAYNGYFYACEFIKRDENNRSNFIKGREILSEIIPYAEGELKDYVSSKFPLSWYFEGAICEMSQSYDEALSLYENALEGYRELGLVSGEIDVLVEIASVKSQLCLFDEAKQVYSQALCLAAQNGNDEDQMKILKNMWQLGETIYDMNLLKSTSASIDSLAEHSADIIMRFEYNLQKGDEAVSKGQYRLAEKWYLDCKVLAEKNTNDTITSSKYFSYKYFAYNKLSNLYVKMQQYDNALDYQLKTKEEFQNHFHNDASSYNIPYLSLADIFRMKGDRKECFACIDSLFVSESFMNEPRERCHLYLARARNHSAFKEYAEALSDYKKADEILAAKYPQMEENRIMILACMGGVEHKLGMFEESEKHYKQYVEFSKQLYGENSTEYINSLVMLANAEGFAKHFDSGSKHYENAAVRMKTLMSQIIPFQRQEERETFWTKASSLFTMMTPYAIEAKMNQEEFTVSCYDALVMSKAFLLESERTVVDLIKQFGTDDDMRDYMQLETIKNRIKEWEKNYSQHSDSIAQWSLRADQLATLLVVRCRKLGDLNGFMDINYETVKNSLKTNEVILDFTDYVSETMGRKYAAYIINKEDKFPLLKYLCTESEIDSIGITRPDMFYNKKYAQHMLKLFWEPLKEHISEGATVYYVPSQLLFQVSLESLPLEDGSLLGSHYNFVRLSSARELVKAQSSVLSSTPKSAVLYGGLQYDLQPTAMAAEAKKYDLSDLLVMRGDIVRGDSVFRELPGSKQEILSIKSLLKANKWKVKTRMGMEGTEESFLSMHGNAPQILQIATHGFYYTPDRAESVEYLNGYTDAMMLSGIALSGANVAWKGKKLPDGVLGGILTANNIARLDLSRTEMVVLSACQTGQGKATPEGLYGLQRAFKKAGVGTIVMALWNVSDKVTTEFMTTFYEQLASKQCQWNKRKAFERTKSIIRDEYPDPFYWAAFVMMD